MNSALWKKAVRESFWLLAACTVVVYGFSWFFVYLVSRVETSRFKGVLDLLKPEIEPFAKVPIDHLIDYAGRIAVCYDEPLVFMTVSIWAIARGSDAVSGPLGRGTLEMILGQPVSRLQYLISHATVTVGGVAVLSLAAWLGTMAGIATTQVKEEPPRIHVPWLNWDFQNPFVAVDEDATVSMSSKVDAWSYIPAAVNLFALGVFVAGLTTMVSAFDRYRWRTIGFVSGFYVVQMMVKLAAITVKELRWMNYCTFFGSFEPQLFVYYAIKRPEYTWSFVLMNGQHEWIAPGPMMCNLLLVGLGLACYATAAFYFSRRDLPAPL